MVYVVVIIFIVRAITCTYLAGFSVGIRLLTVGFLAVTFLSGPGVVSIGKKLQGTSKFLCITYLHPSTESGAISYTGELGCLWRMTMYTLPSQCDISFPGPPPSDRLRTSMRLSGWRYENMLSYYTDVWRLAQHEGRIDWQFNKLPAFCFATLLQSHCGVY